MKQRKVILVTRSIMGGGWRALEPVPTDAVVVSEVSWNSLGNRGTVVVEFEGSAQKDEPHA